MNRIVNWLIALSMVAIAASLSLVLYAQANFPISEAGWIGVAALLVMILGQFITGRIRERSGFQERLEDLSTVTTRLVREVGDLHERLGSNEARLLNNIEDTVSDKIAPVSAEIRLLETLLRQVGDKVAEAPAQVAVETVPVEKQIDEPEAVEIPTTVKRSGAFGQMSDDEFSDLVRESVNESRMDVYLQPIVTLPQRKVRFYEALSRLKTETGKLILPDDFMPAAADSGLMPVIDNMMLYRSIQVVRRLQTRNRDFGLFCNISPESLTDNKFFSQFVDFMEANKVLAPQIVFEFSQASVDDAGPIELASLDRLSELGYTFSMDRITRLDFDPKALFEQNFRFVKIPARMLLSESSRIDVDIDPTDMHDLLSRYGIEMIVDQIERESEVVDLLDYDVSLGQGDLFSPPRPVKADVMGEMPNVTAAAEAV